MNQDEIQEDSHIARNKGVLVTDVNGEAVLLNIDKGNYYGLDAPVGTRIWELLESPRKLSELCSLLSQEFEVASDRCHRETRAFVAELAKEGLVEISHPDKG